MNEDYSMVVISALVSRLGGSVELSRNELMAAENLTLWHSEDKISFVGGIKLSIEDATIVQGVLV